MPRRRAWLFSAKLFLEAVLRLEAVEALEDKEALLRLEDKEALLCEDASLLLEQVDAVEAALPFWEAAHEGVAKLTEEERLTIHSSSSSSSGSPVFDSGSSKVMDLLLPWLLRRWRLLNHIRLCREAVCEGDCGAVTLRGEMFLTLPCSSCVTTTKTSLLLMMLLALLLLKISMLFVLLCFFEIL